MNKYTGIFTRDEVDGGWVAQCAEVPSAITQGETLSEAKQNLKEAIHYMLKVEVKLSIKNAKPKARIATVSVPR